MRTDDVHNGKQSPLRGYWCKWHKCASNLGSHLAFYFHLNSELENRQIHIANHRIDIEVVDMSLYEALSLQLDHSPAVCSGQALDSRPTRGD